MRRQSTRPNGQLVADVVAWIRQKENVTAFGAPWQADAQMVYMYNKFKWIEGIIRFVACTHSLVCNYVCMLCCAVTTVICGLWESTIGTQDT